MIRNNRILFDWFHKLTFSDRYLNYLSQHPLSQKKGTIIGLVDRIFLLLHPEFHQKNLAFIIRVLLENDYPLGLIFHAIGSRIKSLINSKAIQQNNNKDNETINNNKIWFTVPYIKSISDKFENIINGSVSRVSFYNMNKLSRLIKAQKDSLPKSSKMNVVYKINCKDCDASYGTNGQTIKN